MPLLLRRDSALIGVVALIASVAGMTDVRGLSGAAAARADTMMLVAGISFYAAHGTWGAKAHSAWTVSISILVVLTFALGTQWFAARKWAWRAIAGVLAASAVSLGVQGDDRQSVAKLIFDRIAASRRARQLAESGRIRS